jgi:hypothetical protein
MARKTTSINEYSIELFGQEKETIQYTIATVYKGLKSQVPIKSYVGRSVKEAQNQAIKWIENQAAD